MYQFNENLQRGILYLLKNDRDFHLQIVNLVKPDYFEFPVHSKIFSIVRDYYGKYHKLPNDDILIEEARKSKTGRIQVSDFVDEVEYINKLDASALGNQEYFLDLIEDFAKKEAMKDAIKEGVLLLKEDRIEEIESLVRKALTVGRSVDLGQDYFTDFVARWDRVFNPDSVDKYKTILPTLDISLEGGLSAKELAMVIAPPGVGKSLFLVNQSVKSLMEGRKVLYLSLEMAEDKIAQRFDSVMALIPQFRLKDPPTQLKVKERLELFQKTFDNSKLMIKEFPCNTITVNGIRSLLVQLHNHNDFIPDVIVIDYLELLNPVRENMHEYQAQQRISEDLRGLAMEMNCLLWTATQTNRQGRSVKLITDAELGDSYGKIRTCDFAVSLNQTEEEFDEGKMRAYVVKSRNGRPRFTVGMEIDYSTLRMKEDNATEEN